LFFGKSGNDLKAIYLAIKDFLFARKTLDLSLNRILQLYRPPTGTAKNEKELTTPIDKIHDYADGLFVI
jgi:hypothetical protein